jgi:hypothetical protein
MSAKSKGKKCGGRAARRALPPPSGGLWAASRRSLRAAMDADAARGGFPSPARAPETV